jgi:hypothetical protein
VKSPKESRKALNTVCSANASFKKKQTTHKKYKICSFPKEYCLPEFETL